MTSFYRLITFCLLLSLLGCGTGLKQKNILVIGDSNGVGQGWVYKLQAVRGGGPLVNTSLSGNTLGFNYGGDRSKNTLENLTIYLRKGYADMGGIDEILICLGTNDCKASFADKHGEIGENLNVLLTNTKAFFTERGQDVPNIVLLTPPAMDDSKIAEFAGGEACIEALSASIREIALTEGLCLVDLQKKPGQNLLQYSKDGIHFNAEGYELWAEAIVETCY
jgi:lysophospholipase L1-like esterase